MTSPRLSLALAVACLACVLVLLHAERTERVPLKRVSKSLASLAFVALSLTRLPLGTPEPATWLVAGLVLGAVGDVALLGAGQGAFLSGLSAFLLGHLAYVVALSRLSAPSAWMSVVAIPVVLANIGVLAWLWSRLGPMRIPVVAYVTVICTMVVGAIAVGREARPSSAFLLVGALLFAGSDVAVARERFVEDTFVNKLFGLPTYYAGQLCFAWAVGLV